MHRWYGDSSSVRSITNGWQLGGVWVDVDRRYYHSNAGLGIGQTYDQINIQPGQSLRWTIESDIDRSFLSVY